MLKARKQTFRGAFFGVRESHDRPQRRGRKPGRQTESERTMAANLGLAVDDMATAAIIYGQAVDQGIGTWLPL